MSTVTSLEGKLAKADKERAAERKRSENQDVFLGEDRKKELVEIQKELGLKHLHDVIDILMAHFNTSEKIDRSILFKLGTLTKT